ncbi:unnamed protein product [Brassicogethes aeneus]|uniref:Uncharacterized protein n=1 Tax=Brassicogethes aeneus TaxID=1431903 RepID=A0A9P0FRA5_BRAAE|nr:unnamed protein product [Brassicogethes aeneus]
MAKFLNVRSCMSFASDSFFQRVRNSLTESGIIWENIVSKHLSPMQAYGRSAEIDKAFYHKTGIDIVLDRRGFEPQHISCSITTDSVEILAERKIEQGHMKAAKRYLKLRQQIDPNTGECCMSSEGIILLTASWL